MNVKGTGNWMSGRRVEEATRGREEERRRRRRRMKGQEKAKEEERRLRKGKGLELGCGIKARPCTLLLKV